MSKLTITGNAKHKVEADMEKITIRFQVEDKTSAKASQQVIKECECFLAVIKKMGLDLTQIQMSDDTIEQESYSDRFAATATRELTIETKYDIKFNNDLQNIIQEKDLNVDLEVGYFISNKKEIHEALIAEAVADSRKRAEIIVAATGQKIMGIKEMNTNNYCMGGVDLMCCEKERSIGYYPRPEMLSDQLKAPVLEEEESVNITWLVE